MFRNYPATYLFILSLIIVLTLSVTTPIVSTWHLYFAIILKILNFMATVICAFFLLGTLIEVANGMFFRKHLH